MRLCGVRKLRLVRGLSVSGRSFVMQIRMDWPWGWSGGVIWMRDETYSLVLEQVRQDCFLFGARLRLCAGRIVWLTAQLSSEKKK